MRRRAGLPEDVGALVEKLDADAATLVLVNVDAVEPRTVVVQAGGYGEHRFDSVEIERKDADDRRPAAECAARTGSGRTTAISDGSLRESSDAGAALGSRLVRRQR